MGKVVDLFPGWTPVIHNDLMTVYENTRYAVLLPGTGVEVKVCRGHYQQIPVEVSAVTDDDLERVFMRAWGINREQKRANKKRLEEVVKSTKE